MLYRGLQQKLAYGAFQDADIRIDRFGQEGNDVVGNIEVEGDGLTPEDGFAGFPVGSLYIHEKAPLEPADKSVFQAFQLAGRSVAGEDDLLAALVQGIEDMEELFLGAILAAQELDVVHEEDVDLVAIIGRELIDAVMLDRFHELAVKSLRRHVSDFFPWVFGQHMIAYGLQKM